MLSIVVPFRNSRVYASNCLRSIIDTVERLRLTENVEAVLMDDDSDHAEGIPSLFRTFKQSAKFPVMAFRFKKRQHYSRACAIGLSLTAGNSILLLSHDMVLTPSYVHTLLAVSALDETHGIVRGTSPHVECFPQHQVAAPLPYRSYDDIVAFAEFVRQVNGLSFVEDPQLCGDSFLVKRSVIEKIGTFDGRFFGYFGDIDFGLRAQRAGFKLISAKGAWLHHIGPTQDPAKKLEQAQQRSAEMNETYQTFRSKWDPHSLPAQYPGPIQFDTAKLRTAGPSDGKEFQPELEMDLQEVEVI